MLARFLTAFWAIAALSLVACGDEHYIAIGGDDLNTPTPDAQPETDTSETPTPSGSGREIIVLHDASRPLSASVGQTLPIRVKVIDYERGGPAGGTTVEFALAPVDAAQPGSATISTRQTYADDGGVASINFRAGQDGEVGYRITVSASHAEPVSFELFVSDAPRGTLTVSVANDVGLALQNVDLRLVPGVNSCLNFHPTLLPEDVIADATLLSINDQARWSNLPASERFTLVAVARNTDGNLAAAGCHDGIVIIANQDNHISLPLYLLTLNPAGTYDSITHFDFRGAIPGRVGQVIDEITLLFESPGGFLILQVKRLAANYVGNLITDFIFGLFEDKVIEVIDDWALNDSPAWVQELLSVGRDLTQIVTNLEMLADLTIHKVTSAYVVQGNLDWTGIALYWRRGCASEGSPGYDPACGRHEFSLHQFSNTQFPMDIIEGRWIGNITSFNHLDIANHTVKISYGKLVIFVLNELILPAVSGERNLRDAVQSMVNCPRLADRIYFSQLGRIGIEKRHIEGFCTGAIDIIILPATMILESLAVDSQLRLSGNAVMVDNDDDLKVDEFINGRFLGNFESDGREGAPFTGTWTAIRNAF